MIIDEDENDITELAGVLEEVGNELLRATS